MLVFFRIRRGTFPYGVKDDASIISQTPTTHYTNTCVKLTIVAHLSFSERIAIANLIFIVYRDPLTTRLLVSQSARMQLYCEYRMGLLPSLPYDFGFLLKIYPPGTLPPPPPRFPGHSMYDLLHVDLISAPVPKEV